MSVLGIVSNCFRKQLDAGTALVDLIGEASRRGYRAIELRQTCLGEFESGDEPLPQAGLLAVLPEMFPGIRFDVAIAVPFLGAGYACDERVFDAGKWSAQAVAGDFPPHLRLVDPHTQSLDRPTEAIGSQIASLTRAMVAIDGVLSIEHSRQRWLDFRSVFDAARAELGLDADRLRICYDPCNLLIPGDGVDPAEVTASLKAGELSMVHAKQRCDKPMKTVADGEINWKAQSVALEQIGYRGPVLFEIEPDDAIWDHLVTSVDYLRESGFELADI